MSPSVRLTRLRRRRCGRTREVGVDSLDDLQWATSTFDRRARSVVTNRATKRRTGRYTRGDDEMMGDVMDEEIEEGKVEG